MSATTEQKVDYLLKKVGFTLSKTGSVTGTGSISGGTTKEPFAESIPSPLVVPDSSIWNQSLSIPTTPPVSDTSIVKVYSTSSAHRMTADNSVSGSRAFIAYSTYNNTSSARLSDWIDTQFGTAYVLKVYKGDPNSGGTLLPAGGSGSNDGWFFDYSSGVLNFNGSGLPSGVTDTNIYIVGYRYIGSKGVSSPGQLSPTNLFVAGISTFVGVSTFQNDLSVAGQLKGFTNLSAPYSATIKNFSVTVASKDSSHRYQGQGSSNGYLIDGVFAPVLTLTPGRTYKFNLSSSDMSNHPFRFYLDEARSVQYTTNVTTTSTSTQITITDDTPNILHYQCSAHGYMGNAVIINSNVVNSTYSATLRAGLTVTGGETTLSSATVSDLTSGRVVLAGGSGQLQDSGNLTFSGSQLGVTGTINASSTVTGTEFHTGASGSAIRVSSNTISGPATITLDPAAVGNNTGKVIIAGDLQVDGTTTTVNSTTVNIVDKNIQVATGAANDAAADGGGITIASGSGNKTFQFEATGSNLGSSEHLNLASGKDYKINNTSVLNATTLGSGVVNSSLTSVGTLTSLNVTGLIATNGNVNAQGNVVAQGNVTAQGNMNCNGGQLTFSNNSGGKIRFLDTNNNPDFTLESSQGIFQIYQSSGDPIIKINSDKHVDINYNLDLAAGLDVIGATNLRNTNIARDLDVDGLSELDFVNVSAASTFAGPVDINGQTELEDVNIVGMVTVTNVSSGVALNLIDSAGKKFIAGGGGGSSPFAGSGTNHDFRIQVGGTQNAIFKYGAGATGNLELGPASGIGITFNGATGNVQIAGISTFAGAYVNGDLTVNGTADILDSIIHTGDTDTKIRFPSNDQISFETGGSERGRFDNDGNFLIGTNSHGNAGTGARKLVISGPSNQGLTINSTTTSGIYRDCNIYFGYGTSTADMAKGQLTYRGNSDYFHMSVGGTAYTLAKSFRLNSDGTVRLDSTPTATNSISLRLKSHKARAVNDNNGILFTDANDHSQAAINVTKMSTSDGSSDLVFRTSSGQVVNTLQGIPERMRIKSDGHVLPAITNTQDLGSSSKRWRNVYTTDLQLSNEGKTNDVDNTWGDYTIQEGESDLFLINNRNGKKYKFNLTEVS